MLYIKDVELQFNEEKQIIGDFFKIKSDLLKILNNNIGKKCFKVNSMKTAKFKEEIEKITSLKFDNLHYMNLRISHKSIYFTMKYCFTDANKESCHFRELDFYIGSLNDTFQVIKEINNNFETYEKRFNMQFEDIKATIIKVSKLLKECEELQKEMPHYAKFTLPYIGNINN